MKRCPNCQATYGDEANACPRDGTWLAPVPMGMPLVDSSMQGPPKSSHTLIIFLGIILTLIGAAVSIALQGCGHAPPPPPKVVEKPVSSIADIAGKWVASDEMDFAYALTITPEGAFDLWIDRNHMGRCEEKGTLAPPTEKTFQLTYTVNDCHREAKGTSQPFAVESFSGDALTVALGAERHVYRRAQ